MHLRTAARSSPAAGFSLIELMVVVAIATILFALAVPSYMLYVRQSRRSMAEHVGPSLQFAHALCLRTRRAHAFVFSTQLREVTRACTTCFGCEGDLDDLFAANRHLLGTAL